MPGATPAVLRGPLVFFLLLAPPAAALHNATSYATYPEDVAHYHEAYGDFLPTPSTDKTAHDFELFLPVSYHMNPAGFQAYADKTYCNPAERSWDDQDPKGLPKWDYCGFNGRTCYNDPGNPCFQTCAQDLLQAFGDSDGRMSAGASKVRVSSYFTWYSKAQNQPLLSGFWSSAFDGDNAKAGNGLCDAQASSKMCDATCADTGKLPSTADDADAGQTFVGCAGDRACGKFATCALGSSVIKHNWASQQPPGFNTTLNSSQACTAAGYLWRPGACSDRSITTPAACTAAGARWFAPDCTWQPGPDCTTGRCFDRGHIVPSGAMGMQFGRSGQSFTMCNVGSQTSVLNECKWMYLEQAVNCVGRFFKVLTLAGSMGPFSASGHMDDVSKFASAWKVLFFPGSQAGGPAQDTALVWIMSNDEAADYVTAAYQGKDGLAAIEKELGVTFPKKIQEAEFPDDCGDLSAWLDAEKQATCGFHKSTWDPKTDPDGANVTQPERAAWGSWNLLQTCGGAEHSTLPPLPCPQTTP